MEINAFYAIIEFALQLLFIGTSTNIILHFLLIIMQIFTQYRRYARSRPRQTGPAFICNSIIFSVNSFSLTKASDL